MINKTKKWSTFALSAICAIGYLGTAEKVEAQTRALTAHIWTKNCENRRGGRGNTASLFRRANNLGVTTHNISRTNARPQLRDLQAFPQYNDSHFDDRRSLNDLRNNRVGRRAGSNLNLFQWERQRKIDLVQMGCIFDRVNGLAASAYSCVRSGRIETRTSVHEIGHNYSGAHSHAHRFLNRYSVMKGGVSNRHNRFSNPSVRARGQVTGTGSRNNARRIRDRRFSVANRRS